MNIGLTQLIKRSPLLNSESAIHGALCALLSHPLENQKKHWQNHFLQLCHRLSKKELEDLTSYAYQVQKELQHSDYALQLPKEIQQGNLNHQIHYLSQWIDSYIDAFATSQHIQQSLNHCDPQISEWIETLQLLQRQTHQLIAQSEKTDYATINDDGEMDLLEITEFIRTCIYLCHTEWHSKSKKS